ncbi:MAG TPA: methylated-DNA--[protein]-cysteine S-methyltransferase [Actinomycetota bacterium]|nr:methylated-DNA--[protein]-cysteine S-methyltransferase [Actinomycetota bacterium]
MTDVERALARAWSGTAEAAEAAARRVAERAAADGLADVAYGWADSPFGPLLVAATPRGLVRLAYEHEQHEHVLEELAESISSRVLEAPGRLDEVRRELEEYFVGRRHRFEVPVDWTLITEGFPRRVLRATARVPYGGVTTYGDVARRAGSPRAARAAGNALGSNPIPIVVPCHRVIRSGGELGGYGGGGPERKAFLLRLEGAVD